MREKSSTFPHRHLILCLPAVIASGSLLAVILSWQYLAVPGQLAIVGILGSVSVGIAVAILLRTIAVARWEPSFLETPFLLAHDAEVFKRYQGFSESLFKLSRSADPICRSIALEQLNDLLRTAAAIADGTFVFEGTETWRLVYERLLRSPGLHRYRSVAWVKNENYWQDEPGRKSMAVNFELHESERLSIERIAIIADELWPAGELWPVESIRRWLHEQHVLGIETKFVRESVLRHEPELVADIGIYGSRALGIQELDEQCRTMRFVLSFDFRNVTEAESRWDRVSVYAESYGSYLDRYERDR